MAIMYRFILSEKSFFRAKILSFRHKNGKQNGDVASNDKKPIDKMSSEFYVENLW